jgi:hypothetical protein
MQHNGAPSPAPTAGGAAAGPADAAEPETPAVPEAVPTPEPELQQTCAAAEAPAPAPARPADGWHNRARNDRGIPRDGAVAENEFTEMCNELIEDREEILRDIHERGVDMAATLADLGSRTHAVEIEGLEVTFIQEAEAAMALDHELVTFHSVRALQVWLFLQWSAFFDLENIGELWCHHEERCAQGHFGEPAAGTIDAEQDSMLHVHDFGPGCSPWILERFADEFIAIPAVAPIFAAFLQRLTTPAPEAEPEPQPTAPAAGPAFPPDVELQIFAQQFPDTIAAVRGIIGREPTVQDLRDGGVPLGFSSAAAATVAAEDEDERLDPRYNSHEAFAEWFDGEVRSLDDVEGAGENFDTVMEEWCRNNNHEIRDDGVYNMNIPTPGWSLEWILEQRTEAEPEPESPIEPAPAPEASETRKETTVQSCQRGYQDRADELQPLLDCGFGPGRHFGTEADWQCGMIEYGQCCYEAADAPADTCFVCMDDISAGDASANPGCMHNLHLHCFMQLMRHGIQQCGICSRQYGLPVLAPAPAPAPRHGTFFRALAPAPAQPTCSPSEAPQGPLPTCPVPGSTGFLTAQAALAWLGSNPETYSPFYVPFLHAVYQTGLLTEQIEVWRDLVGHDIWDEFVRRYRIAMTIGGRRLDNRDPGHNGVNGYIAAAHQDWLINIDPALGQELMQTILQMQQQQPAAAAGGGAAAGMRIHLLKILDITLRVARAFRRGRGGARSGAGAGGAGLYGAGARAGGE